MILECAYLNAVRSNKRTLSTSHMPRGNKQLLITHNRFDITTFVWDLKELQKYFGNVTMIIME